MNNYLNEFKQKKEENKLSLSAYNNLIHNNLNIPQYKMGNKKISIIIPTHNRFEQLKELINSIFNQTYQNFEIIIIDDLSTDKTNEVYDNYPNKRLKYFRNYEHLGVGLNRQKGYNLSQGDYIIFCDDDDYFIDNDYFSDLINIFKDERVNLVCSESYTHYEKENKYTHLSINLDEGIIDSTEYLKNFMIKYKKPTSLFPAAFRRKILIEAQFKEMTMMNDTPIYLRALMIRGLTFINKKIVGIYRIHGENKSFHLKSEFIIKNLEEKKKIYYYLKQQDMIPNLDEWYAKQIAITVKYYLNNVNDKEDADKVLNWVYEKVSYGEYLKYKKEQIRSLGLGVYYYNGKPNFGDMLNEDILSSIFKLEFQLDTFQNADLCCVGSIFDKLITNSHIGKTDKEMQNECEINKPLHIWGTGLMFHYEDIMQTGVRPFIIHALRGEKTRKRLSDILGKNISCVLADPGILSPILVRPSEKKYKVGIIPHFLDKEEEIFERMLEYYPNSKIIDVQNETKQVLKEISMCEYIISTSLHGLIVADSYGIPNCWCEISDRVQGKGFKFHDYFSSFGTDRKCFDLRNEKFPDIKKDFKCNFKSINQLHEKQKELIECFPFNSNLFKNIFYDKGIIGDKNYNWYDVRNNIVETVTENGTLLKHDKNDTGLYFANAPNSQKKWANTFYWKSPFIIEIDILEYSNSVSFRISDKNIGEQSIPLKNLEITKNNHIKIINTGQHIEFYKDGMLITNQTIYKSLQNCQIGFRIANGSLKFRNFKIIKNYLLE